MIIVNYVKEDCSSIKKFKSCAASERYLKKINTEINKLKKLEDLGWIIIKEPTKVYILNLHNAR